MSSHELHERDGRRGFQRHARNVSLLTMVSRVTGLGRDAALSRVFGAGSLMDAFFFAFMIPNLFRRLFGEGALAAAFLPEYTQLNEDDPAVARQLATLTISRLVTLLGILTVAGELVLYGLVSAGGFGSTALHLMMIMLPYMPLVCLVAILGAILQTHGRFGPTAAAPVILNLTVIGAALGLPWLFADLDPASLSLPDDAARRRVTHITLVAVAVVVAGCAQVAWSMIALRRTSWWTRTKSDQSRDRFRRVIRQAVPMMIGLGVLQLNTLIDGLIASYPTTVGPTIFGRAYPLEEGAMSAVSFAQRLYQFPLGVFGIAVATAIFPALSRLHADDQGFRSTLRRGLRLVFFIAAPASIGLILVRTDLTAAIFEGGAFESSNTQRVASVLAAYAPGVWAYSMMHVLTRAFYARQDARTPVRVAVAMVALNLLLNVTLIWTPLRETALGWSTAICSMIQVAVLIVILRQRLGGIVSRVVWTSWLRTLLLSTVMAVVVGVWIWCSQAWMSGDSWWLVVGRLGVSVVLGTLVMGVGARLLRMPELGWSLGRDRA